MTTITAHRPHHRLNALFGLAGVFAIACLLRWPVAPIPLERDEGEYAYIAQRWLAGEPPYASAFDQKPPGVFAIYAVILSTFGSSPTAIHWGAQVYTLATLAAIYCVGRRLFGETAGLIAALLASFMTADRCVLGNAANTEIFMILPLTAGFLATLKATERNSVVLAATAGACAAFAILFKQVALPNVVFQGVLLLLAQRGRWRLLSAYTIVFLAALAAVVGYFAAVGAFRDFVSCVLAHNLAYAGQVPYREYPRFFVTTFSNLALQWFPILLFAVGGMRSRALPSNSRRLAVWWLAVSFLGVAVGGYFREHYYIQAIPPLAVLAGAGVVAIATRWLPTRIGIGSTVLAGTAVAYGVFAMPWSFSTRAFDGSPRYFWAGPAYYLRGSPTDKCRMLYSDAPFPEATVAGEFLAERATPADRIFVFGNEPQIYFYADRRAACRYIYVYPLFTPTPGVLEKQQSALDELTARPPRFIVVHTNVMPFYFGDPPPEHFRDEIAKMLARDYRLIGVIGPNDANVRPFSGPVAPDATMWPPVEHTLAIWQRRE